MQELKKRGPIYHKFIQVLAYADYFEIIGRTTSSNGNILKAGESSTRNRPYCQ
jgi:hypothetical protein